MAQAKAMYDMTVHPTTALVRSQSNGAAAHAVTLPSCDCADFINRRGRLVEADGGIAVTLCKHIEAALLRIGGWNREVPPGPVTYESVTRDKAVTILTSAYIASSLVDSLLHAALGTWPLSATAETTNGPVSARYDRDTRRYTLTIPGNQPAQMPVCLAD
jgi:hypothetical protein